MSRILIALFFGLILLSCGPVQQNLGQDKTRIDNVCDSFMQKFVAGKMDEALWLLKHNTVMQPSSIDTLKATISDQVKNVFPLFGKMLSSEFVKESNIKNFIAKRFYIIKFSKFFLKVDFTLYNSSTGWTITSFHYSEEADELLD